ncbi:6512_t:CDS:2, partial [Racocetra persica]
SKDQELVAGNLALKISCETKRPIRVIRYRYDGLYTVEKWWESIGKSGYKVYKYVFKRMEGQPPLGTCFMPLDKDEDENEDENKNEDNENGNEDEDKDGNEDENEDGNEDENEDKNEDEDGNTKKKLKL